MEKIDIKIREDLNDMVKDIKFVKIKTRYGDRVVCNVTLFNNEIIEFSDKDGVYALFTSYLKCGETNFIKSKELVEEYKKNDEGEIVGSYICVKYTLKDDSVYRFFVSRFTSLKILDNYYNLFKKQVKTLK